MLDNLTHLQTYTEVFNLFLKVYFCALASRTDREQASAQAPSDNNLLISPAEVSSCEVNRSFRSWLLTLFP